ncbi:ribose-phosphate pyrophosphokinase [Ramlibacter sp. WS9]|uniref:ribose-phosphate pyrophosphokinase n=1 Tax=Ramlibacter sp. WS9 TaxID=1882741 RepID=UPI0011423998|nr:ribose-phosphate pyrophosphokinase [Ramlibacter sp. WS9]ROZ75410.1 ribose-phosphate pyrophosphokinase [Ramlibacter sp. WS9]
MKEKPALIVAIPGGAALAQSLAHSLNCDWTELAVHTFPDGETLVRIDAEVAARRVILAGSLHQPDGKTLPMLFAADAARELGASQVGLVAPYLAYMRQDHRFNPGEAVTSRTYARLLSSSFDFVVTVDPHLHRWHSLEDVYTVPARVVPSAPAIAAWVRGHVERPLIVGPDEESEQWVAHVARLAHAPWTVMAKTRRGDRDVSVELRDAGPWPGCTPVLLDDIVSTAQTMIAAAGALEREGWPPPVCVAVHALFDPEDFARLRGSGVSRVVTCDTVPHSSNGIALAPAIADAVRTLSASTPSTRHRTS